MMKRYRTFLMVAGLFFALSAIAYLVHYLIFRDTHHIFIYMIGDLAFLPIDIFLVVIVIERLLARREKAAILQKLNMVVGAFYSEVGTELLNRLLGCFEECDEIQRLFGISPDWKHADFKKAIAFADALDYEPQHVNIDLEELRNFLVSKRQFLLALLENPNLLEHDRFTDLLWATFHLTEELEARTSFDNLPESDLAHIAIDIKRVFGHLAAEWLEYVEHLQGKYPYLFSLVSRTHPFQESPSPVVVA
jgi:hypothetical protein